jgi:putative nucleotidyltransferase with HDIG domain
MRVPAGMKNAGSTVHIEVDALQVGMFIHLDMGWMSHPFPLSSFRIASAQQIATIRSLGLKKLRWSPEQSALDDADQAAEAAPAAVDPAPALTADETPDQRAQRERRARAAQERAALALCERQFSEATHESKLLTDLVVAQPAEARTRAVALTQAFAQKMVGDQEVCIRLLTEAAGDRACAHAVNVTVISMLMGRSFGLSETEMLDLGVGALLHDVGKLDLPPRVRHREEHFTPSEVKFYEEHVTHGVSHALKMGLTPGATLVIAQHHEHADGSGFPLKLGHERMTPASCIVSLVNRYDNLCNPHVPSKALTPHEALSLLFAQGKNKFDTAVLNAFIKMMGVYPPGSVVQLTDDRYGMVVGVNASRPLKPRVSVFDPNVPEDEALVVDLEQTPKLGIRRSIRAGALPAEAAGPLSPRTRVAYFFEAAREPEDACA